MINLSGLADFSFTDLSAQLSVLYNPSCCPGSLPNLSADEDLQAALLTMIKRVYKEKGLPPGIDKKVTKYYAEQLWSAVTEGYGEDLVTVDYDTPDFAMLEKLQTNVYQFSAAKNYNQLKSLTQALVDTEGKVRSFSDFRQAAMEINDQHINQWLLAEYNNAIASSQMAATWTRIEEDKADLPMLKYITANDDHVRQSHKELEGVVRPINDGFWDLYYPPNGWGCRCDVQQLENVKPTPLSQVNTPVNVPSMFKINVGKQGVAFPPGHPYYNGLPDNILTQGESLKPKQDD